MNTPLTKPAILTPSKSQYLHDHTINSFINPSSNTKRRKPMNAPSFYL